MKFDPIVVSVIAMVLCVAVGLIITGRKPKKGEEPTTWHDAEVYYYYYYYYYYYHSVGVWLITFSNSEYLMGLTDYAGMSLAERWHSEEDPRPPAAYADGDLTWLWAEKTGHAWVGREDKETSGFDRRMATAKVNQYLMHKAEKAMKRMKTNPFKES